MKNESTLESFLKLINDPNFTNDRERTLLHLAVLYDRVTLIPNLISCGVDIDRQDFQGSTALHLATKCANMDAVTALMDFSPQPHMLDHSGMAPLHYAVIEECDQLVRLLVITGSLWDVPNADGLTAFQLACSCAHFNIMRSFLEEGSDPNGPSSTETKDTPLLLVLKSTCEVGDCLDLLLEYGAKTDCVDSKGNSMLHAAMEGCCVAAVAKMLSWRFNITATTNQCQETAMHSLVKHRDKHMAANRSSEERKWVAAQLIQYGIKILANDIHGNSAVYLALLTSDLDITQILLQYIGE